MPYLSEIQHRRVIEPNGSEVGTLKDLAVVPQGQFQKHLHTLAKIAKLLHRKEFRTALETAPDAPAMCATIKAESGK